MSCEDPQLFISCIGYHERLVLEEAIADAIASNQELAKVMRELNQSGDMDRAVKRFEERIIELKELRTIVTKAKLCVPEG